MVYIIFNFSKDPKRLLKAKLFQNKIVLYFSLLTLSEIILLIWNYSKFGSDSQDFNVLGSFVGFASTLICLLIVYIALYYAIDSDLDLLRFIRGSMLCLAVMGVLVLVPQLLVSIGKNYFIGWVNLVDHVVIPHWNIPSDYTAGSYVATMKRANGLEIEPAFLAGQLAVVFLPWILSAIKHHFSFIKNEFKKMPYEAYLLLLLILATFALAKTTTGLVAIALTVLILVFDFHGRLQKIFIAFSIIGLAAVTIGYFTIGSINGFLNGYLFAKGGQSASNRSGGTIGLIMTFLHYPLIGVGNGYLGHYLIEYVPRNSKLNTEFLWGFSHHYSVLSDWGGFLAQYGLLFFLPIVRKVRELFYDFNNELEQDNLSLLVKDAAKYTVIMYGILAIFDFNWLSYYSLISLLVFVRFVQYRIDKKQVVKS
ncbi:hypothetical protein OAL24_01510 [Oenococcus sicerae]|nr:hypothetical protein OAL24_01510 [Oenococcus sicerae]